MRCNYTKSPDIYDCKFVIHIAISYLQSISYSPYDSYQGRQTRQNSGGVGEVYNLGQFLKRSTFYAKRLKGTYF